MHVVFFMLGVLRGGSEQTLDSWGLAQPVSQVTQGHAGS